MKIDSEGTVVSVTIDGVDYTFGQLFTRHTELMAENKKLRGGNEHLQKKILDLETLLAHERMAHAQFRSAGNK